MHLPLASALALMLWPLIYLLISYLITVLRRPYDVSPQSSGSMAASNGLMILVCQLTELFTLSNATSLSSVHSGVS